MRDQHSDPCCEVSHAPLGGSRGTRKIILNNTLVYTEFVFVFFFFVELTRGLFGFDQNRWPVNLVWKQSTQVVVESFSRWNHAGLDKSLSNRHRLLWIRRNKRKLHSYIDIEIGIIPYFILFVTLAYVIYYRQKKKNRWKKEKFMW